MVRVLLVENHEKMAQLTVRYLREMGKMEVAAIVNSGEAALEEVARLAQSDGQGGLPDLVFIDVSLPTMSGVELVAALQEAYPELLCIMLSGYREPAFVQRSLAAGARGYIVKDNLTAIVEAARRVLDGEIYLSDEVRGTSADRGEQGL